MKKILQLLALVTLLALGLASCAKREASPMASGAVSANPAVDSALPGFVGDGPYAVVRADALPGYYDDFRKELFDKGVTKWDARFDCNHFASYYIAKAQVAYYLVNFHASTAAQTLALAEVWYKPAWAGGRGHAIVAAWTDQGLLFIEPQDGKRVALNDAERASVFLCKW